MIATSFAVLALIAQPLVALNLPAAFAIGTNTVTVRGNTAAGENQPGWMFNRDVSTSTPFEFKPGNASIGSGGLYVSPVANDFTGTCSSSTPAPMPGCDKFIGEYFYLDSVDSFNSMSYDFKIAGSGTNASAGQFYANVYISNTNSPYHYKDCKLDFVPSVGSTSGYTTYTFDKDTVATKVSGTNCGTGTKLDDFAGQYIRMIAINVGDTSSNDAGLAGYYDNVVVNGTSSNTFDFEPFVPSIPSNLGFVSSDQVCGGYTNTNWTQPKWGAVVGATSYDYRALYNGSVVFNATYTIPQHPGGSFGSGTNGQWGYQVRSVASNGMKSDWTPVCTIVLDTSIPVAPVLSSPVNGAVVDGGSITQSWGSSSTGVNHYIYESYHDAGATNLRWHQEIVGTSKTATNVANTAYWWRVKAVDHAGNVSAWSPLWEITVDNDAPVVVITAPTIDLTNGDVEVRATVTDANLRHYWFQIKKNGMVIKSQTVLSSGITNKLLQTLTGDGDYEITVAARDKVGGTASSGYRSSDVVKTVTIDKTAPPAPTADFTPNTDGTQKVELEDAEAGVSIYYTVDGATPTTSSTSYNGAFNITPVVAPSVLTIKAIAVDAAGNISPVLTVAGPSITNQASQTATTSAITLVWTTGTPATSRVVYDTVPHAVLGSDANYGYAFSTAEDTTKTTNHSVTITGLTPGTTYYFRIVSHGSPTTVSPEITSLTLNEQLTRQNGTPTFQVNTPQGDGVVAVAQNGDGAVLGTETGADNNAKNDPDTNTTSDKDVKGAEDVKGDDATSPLGVAWYWWLLGLAALASLLWWLLAWRRRRNEEE